MPAIEKVLGSGISSFIERDVPRIENTASSEAALDRLESAPSGSVLVIDSGTNLLSGIITESDLSKARRNNPQTAGDLATKQIVAIRDDAQLWQLLKIMNGENALGRRLDSLPVVDAQGNAVGVVKREKLMQRLSGMDLAQ
jgi:CBS domain-containing protein